VTLVGGQRFCRWQLGRSDAHGVCVWTGQRHGFSMGQMSENTEVLRHEGTGGTNSY